MSNTFNDGLLYESKLEVSNGAPWSFSKCWDCVIQQYGLPLIQHCINILYAVYTYCTPMNVALFFVKSLPTGVYVYNFVKSIYATSRERMKLRQIELEDLQLQIQIVNTKLSVRDAEFTERALELHRVTERLRRVRARVREVITADEELKRSLHDNAPWEDESDTNLNSPPEEREFIVQLLKGVKYDQGVCGERPPEMNCGEQTPATEDSMYSSASGADNKQNCRVKIVKVTNVYKVNHLKHYIKQIRLRRATKHAVLRKKMENVKKTLEDWQQTLNMVINSKIAIFDMDSYVELASQEAMGDCTKQDLRDLCESNCDLRNLDNYEQLGLCINQNTCTNLECSFEDVSDVTDSKEYKPYSEQHLDHFKQSECSPRTVYALSVLPEETKSQLAIAEVRSETSDEFEGRDIVSI